MDFPIAQGRCNMHVVSDGWEPQWSVRINSVTANSSCPEDGGGRMAVIEFIRTDSRTFQPADTTHIFKQPWAIGKSIYNLLFDALRPRISARHIIVEGVL
jgi:hypothetical protein